MKRLGKFKMLKISRECMQLYLCMFTDSPHHDLIVFFYFIIHFSLLDLKGLLYGLLEGLDARQLLLCCLKMVHVAYPKMGSPLL